MWLLVETIAPETSRTRPLTVLLGVVAAIGAVVTFAAITRGIQGAAGARAFGSGAVMLGAGGPGALWLWLWERNYRLLVGPGMFGYQDVLGRRQIWPASEVANILDVTIRYGKRYVVESVFILGLDGRRLIAINPIAWKPASINRLVGAIGRPMDTRPAPITAADFRREFPRAMSWVSAHPSVGGGMVIAAVVLPIVILLVALLLRP